MSTLQKLKGKKIIFKEKTVVIKKVSLLQEQSGVLINDNLCVLNLSQAVELLSKDKMKCCLILILLFSQVVNADDLGKVVSLNKGQAAPFTGYLMDDVKAQRIRIMDLELQSEVKQNKILEQQVILLNNQNIQNVEYINRLSKQIQDDKESTFLSKVGFFLIGSAVTTLIAYGASRVVR